MVKYHLAFMPAALKIQALRRCSLTSVLANVNGKLMMDSSLIKTFSVSRQ